MDQTLKYNIVGDASSLLRAHEAAKQSGAALTAQLSSGFNETTVTIQRSTAAVTEMQARINRMVGIPTPAKSVKEWTGALANISTGLGTTAQGFKLNRVGMMEFQAAGVNAFQALASGMSLARVAQMEGAQVIGAVIQGSEGGIQGLGASILGLVTKFPLLTAAVAAAGTAFALYETFSSSSIRSLDDILKNHAENIKRLGDAYDQVVGKQQKYAQISVATANLINDKDLADAKTKLTAAIDDILASAFTQNGFARSGGGGMLKTAFAPFQQAIDELKSSAKDTSALRAFTDAVTAIAAADPKLARPANQLLSFGKDALDAAAAVRLMSAAIPDAVTTVDEFARMLAGVNSKPVQKALQDIFDTAREGNQPLDAVITKLNELENANPTFVGIIEGFRKLIDEANRAAGAVANINLGGTRTKDDNAFPPTLYLPTNAPTPDDRPNAEDIGAADDKRQARANRAGDRAANAYRDVLKSAQDRIDQMKVELDLTGQVGMAADTLRNYQELLSRATDKGRTIGEKQKQELHDRAEEMAKLEEATKAAKIQQDLLFDRQQMFRSPTEQDVYGTLHNANIDINSAAGSAIAAQIRLNDTLKETRDLAGDFVSTFTDGLKSGENAFKAFGDAALSVLDKIADKLLNSALDGLFGSIFGGLGGGSSAVVGGSLLQDVFASAKGNVFSGQGISAYSSKIVDRPTLFPFAKGVGLMGEAGTEGILPLRRNSSGQLGVMASVAANANQTAAYNDNRTFHIDARGAQQGVGAEIQQALAAYDRQMPARVKQINMDPRKR